MKKSEKDMSFSEIISDYTIISETKLENKRIIVLCSHSGFYSTLEIPNHTYEEEKNIAENVTMACADIVYPNTDWSNTKEIKIII
ncbi:MAG: hypothetical protein IJZ64_00510 [Ruminococcus sp.]|nr:hypothetical protein [Ruminococcus sp.]